MQISFIHVSDIHLGRPFSDLSKYSYNEKIKNLYNIAVEKAFNNFIDYALLKNVDFVLIAGDTFDSSEQDFRSKLLLKEGLQKLNNADIKVFLICGNHDPLSGYNKNTFNFDENSNIKIIGLNTEYFGKFPVVNRNGEQIALIHALSYQENSFKENPVKYFESPTSEEKKLFNIGLMHIDRDSDKSSDYAPCNTGELQALEYDYYALGHIHIPDSDEGKIQYSGTIQGRNTKETGAHGIKYIKVENNLITKNTFVPTDVIRFENLEIDLSSLKDETSAFSFICEKISEFINKNRDNCELFLLKLYLNGSVSFYSDIDDNFCNLLSEKISDEFNNKVCISRIENNTIPDINEELIKSDEGISGEIYNTINSDDNRQEDVWSGIENTMKNFINQCDFTEDEYKEFKKSVINSAKEECLNLCGKIYYNENKEV